MSTTMLENPGSIARQVLRSPLLTAGFLVCALGIGNWIVGSGKLAHYERLVAETSEPPGDGVILSSGFTFTDVSESQELHNIAVAKVQYYSVVLGAGELFVAFGLGLLLTGYSRIRKLGTPEAPK